MNKNSRTKQEIARDLDIARDDLQTALRETSEVVHAHCAAWRSQVAARTALAHGAIRSHVYSISGAALAAGGLVGLLLTRK